MKRLVFECELVSPIFMYGTDQRRAELRAPSLKGSLRFWWRAVQAERDITKLRAREGSIFGGTGSKVATEEESGDSGKQEGRSSFAIKITSNGLNRNKEQLLPHKSSSFSGNAIVNGNFKIECSYVRLPESFSSNQLQDLVELVSLLGGLGKRSRRGFGCFRILSCNGERSELADLKQEDIMPAILKRLNNLSGDKFSLNNGVIKLNNNPNSSYPYIETINLGRSDGNVKSLLKKIGDSSHEHNSKYTGDGRERLASPEYVSLIKGVDGKVWPVVTSLHLAFNPRSKPPTGRDTRNAFREAILS